MLRALRALDGALLERGADPAGAGLVRLRLCATPYAAAAILLLVAVLLQVAATSLAFGELWGRNWRWEALAALFVGLVVAFRHYASFALHAMRVHHRVVRERERASMGHQRPGDRFSDWIVRLGVGICTPLLLFPFSARTLAHVESQAESVAILLLVVGASLAVVGLYLSAAADPGPPRDRKTAAESGPIPAPA